MAPLWGAVYGSWRVVSWWMLTWLIPIVLVSVVDPTAGGIEGSTLALITVIADFAGSAIRLWIGMHAFGWLWRRETMRLQLVPGAVPRLKADAFLARQRWWAIAGASLLVASLGGLTIMLTSTDAQIAEVRDLWGLSQLEVGLAMAWMVVELGLAAYLATTMRKGAPKGASEEAE